MMDINQHRLNSEYYTIFYFLILFHLFSIFIYLLHKFILYVFGFHVIYYIDYSNLFILSSHYDSFYRYDMYLYIRTYSHYVTYLVNYKDLRRNTKHGTVGTQWWVHKLIHFHNFDYIANPYLQIQSLYILIPPMYDDYKKMYYILS